MKTTQQYFNYGLGQTIYGECGVVFTDDSLYVLGFTSNFDELFHYIRKHYKNATFSRNDTLAGLWIDKALKGEKINLKLLGTQFQQQVWNELLQIPGGSVSTYSQIAEKIGNPKAIRAVGSAIGANPVSVVVPCHRVIRTDGKPGGYRWGLKIKALLLQHEAAGGK